MTRGGRPPLVTPEGVESLTQRQLSQVLRLVQAATDVDQVAPLSEQVMLAASEGPGDAEVGGTSRTGPTEVGTAGAGTSGASGTFHLLTYSAGHLSGYAHLARGTAGEPATAELMVDPVRRRQGIGTALIRAVETASAPTPARSSTLHVWSHGDLPSGRAFALQRGYATVRELWQMRRSLQPDGPALPATSLPEGFRSRFFVVGQDEAAWLRVNTRAFVNHPEQGRVTRHDLDRRIAEPWFDAKGFILVEDMRGPEPVLAASHWTKVVPTQDSEPTEPAEQPKEGEVYVVGVDPAYQALGVGRTVTVLGLMYLRGKGLTEATLYVDADNRAAISTYSRLGFARSTVDIMYSRIVHSPM